MSWLDNFLRRLKKTEQTIPSPAPMDASQAVRLATSLQHTYDQEVSCEQAYQLLDEFAEAVIIGKDAAALMPLVRYHLDLCADCREEFEILLAILSNSLKETPQTFQ